MRNSSTYTVLGVMMAVFRNPTFAFLIFGLIPTGSALAEPLSGDDFVGIWELLNPTEYDISFLYLRIVPDGQGFVLCKTKACIGQPEGSVEHVEDLVILKHSVKDQSIKIVLGGYQSSETILFGTRYHYHGSEIINGLRLTYKRLELE